MRGSQIEVRDSVTERLRQLRGEVAPRRHNARTIAALTGNPGCARRAVLDSAGVDKSALAGHTGFPARFGRSRFAITRGNSFEARVKANGCADLLGLLTERLGAPVAEAGYTELSAVPDDRNDVRYDTSRRHILTAATGPAAGRTLLDHPMLRLDVAGRPVYLEPDLVAARIDGRFHVVEIKSFPVLDGQADPGKVAAAAIQAAVYVLALRDMLADSGHDPGQVSHEVLLVCPRDFGNEPVAALLDVRRQLATLRRQLARMARIDELLATLPPDLTFDLAPDSVGRPTRPAGAVTAALASVPARYTPDCLDTCELAYYCRHEACGRTAALGRSVREELGGVDRVDVALGLATGRLAPSEEQTEAATLLRAAARLRAEALA